VGFDPRGYEGSKPEKVEKRRQLVAEVTAAMSGWLDLSAEQHERRRGEQGPDSPTHAGVRSLRFIRVSGERG
jgi:hypothetical protein